jgi:hypothetical protein
MGKRVVCQHCSARFLAADPQGMNLDATMLDRADELIEEATRSTINARAKSPV